MSTLTAIIRDLAPIKNESESTSPAVETTQCKGSSDRDEVGQAAALDAIAECGAVMLRSFQEISQEWLGAWGQVLVSQAALLGELVENSPPGAYAQTTPSGT